MTDHNDALVGIKFLVRTAREIAHRHVSSMLDTRNLVFPGLAHVQQREFLTLIQGGLHLFGSNLVIHDPSISEIRLRCIRVLLHSKLLDPASA